MVALGAPKNGLVADRRVRTVMCTRKTRWHPAVICAAALSALLLACNVVLGDRSEDSEPVDIPDSVPPPNAYSFAVYALEQTARQTLPMGTVFQFDESDLPFSITSVCFGDFRQDDTFQAVYYGCSGLLMNASGVGSAVTLYEGSGKWVVDIQYHGQDPVVIGSEVRTDSYSDMVACTGTDVIVMDWIEGDWTPGEGIFVEHSEDVVFTNAKFFVMVFTPEASTEVPELQVVVGSISMLFVVVAILNRRRSSGASSQ